MSNTFRKLVNQSRRITRDEFAISFGGIADDVVEILDSEQARNIVREAREVMESAEPLSNGRKRLREVDFGWFSTAPESEKGEVAAVDGTNTLPMQMYSAGQALSVGIGRISYRRSMQESLHYWSSKIELSEAKDSDDFIKIEEEGLYGISQTAYLRYYEVLHGLEIPEVYILFDGTF